MNKLTSSFSSFNLNNKRNRTPSMESIAPLLRRIKRSLFNHDHRTSIKEQNKRTRPVRRSNTVNCNSSKKQSLFTGEGMYIALHMHSYISLINEMSNR